MDLCELEDSLIYIVSSKPHWERGGWTEEALGQDDPRLYSLPRPWDTPTKGSFPDLGRKTPSQCRIHAGCP